MIFVDTSFWVALASSNDDHHLDAAALWGARGEPLATSNHVLGETWTFLNRRHGQAVAGRFLSTLRESKSLATVHISADAEDEAWRWLSRHDERQYSFVDATSFAHMRRSRIRNAFAFDADFSAAGFVELRP